MQHIYARASSGQRLLRKLNLTFMKYYRLLLLMPCLLVATHTLSASVTEGRSALIVGDLTAAYTAFKQTAAEQHQNDEANTLAGITALLHVFEEPAFIELFSAMGGSWSGNVFDGWEALDLSEVDLAQAVEQRDAWIESHLIPRIKQAEFYLNRVSPAVDFTLSAAETHLEPVRLSNPDILTLQAMLHGLGFVAAMHQASAADELSSELNQLANWTELPDAFPELLAFNAPAHLASARAYLGEALWYAHHVLNLLTNRGDQPYLFELDAADVPDLRESIEYLWSSLVEPTDLPIHTFANPYQSDHITLDLNPLFDNQLNIPVLLPELSNRQGILPYTYPDPTFNGVLPGMSQNKLNSLTASPA